MNVALSLVSYPLHNPTNTCGRRSMTYVRAMGSLFGGGWRSKPEDVREDDLGIFSIRREARRGLVAKRYRRSSSTIPVTSW